MGSTSYTPRHGARHSAPQCPGRGAAAIRTAVRRPAIGGAVAIAMLGRPNMSMGKVSTLLDASLGPICSIILITGAGGQIGGDGLGRPALDLVPVEQELARSHRIVVGAVRSALEFRFVDHAAALADFLFHDLIFGFFFIRTLYSYRFQYRPYSHISAVLLLT